MSALEADCCQSQGRLSCSRLRYTISFSVLPRTASSKPLVSLGPGRRREGSPSTPFPPYPSLSLPYLAAQAEAFFLDPHSRLMTEDNNYGFGRLPNHLLIEILVRVPTREWGQISCVNKHWAAIFQGESFWQTAIVRTWPSSSQRKRWPGPIPRGSGRRRFAALHVSEHIMALDGEIDELVGHSYLYLKEQLELSKMPPPSSILHGTIIDQFIACGRSGDKAHELASQIWLAVINNMEENEHTFLVLKRLAQEGDFFLPYPYSRSYEVLWRVFEKLFTDFRDCFIHTDYYEVLACAKARFQPIPSAWLGY